MEKNFNKLNFELEIIIPANVKIIHLKDKVRFRGNKEDISLFAQEFHKLAKLENGQLCKLGKYTLKISDYKTPDRERENWIELPNHAWNIMGCKFNEVSHEYEDNPFDFNICGYCDKNPFDLGVEVTDLPLRHEEYNDDGSVNIIITER